MIKGKSETFSYLLIDNGLLHDTSLGYTETNSASRPRWLAPIYTERATAVSPLLVDIGLAYEDGDIQQMMKYVNARPPALHVSILESELNIEQLAKHLQRFIFILDPDGKQFTLRYADCAVLAPLSSLLTPEQWATMRGPITRWHVHNRSGTLSELPPIEVTANNPTPMHFSQEQLIALDETSEPDHCIAKVKMMRSGISLPGSAAEHYEWAVAARHAWRKCNNSNPLILTSLTEATIFTRGKLLFLDDVQESLATDDIESFRRQIDNLSKRLTIPSPRHLPQ